MEGCRFRTLNDYRNVVNFDNGFQLSIVCNYISYGGHRGLFEAALLKDGECVYHEQEFPDVKGNLSFQDVADLINKVRQYPADFPYTKNVFLSSYENTNKEVQS